MDEPRRAYYSPQPCWQLFITSLCSLDYIRNYQILFTLHTMFLEHPAYPERHTGWIEVICGSMFSGKTEELIRRLKRAQFAKLNVEIFKPISDSRYAESDVVSHDANAIPCTAVENAQNILLLGDGMDVIGIDEAQFFDDNIVDVCNQLANSGVRVIVAGLDMDYTGKPFGPMPSLMATAEYVTKVHAICVHTGNLAHYSHRIVPGKKQVMLGEKSEYEPVSRATFNKLRK
jgi:thymidine kinase